MAGCTRKVEAGELPGRWVKEVLDFLLGDLVKARLPSQRRWFVLVTSQPKESLVLLCYSSQDAKQATGHVTIPAGVDVCTPHTDGAKRGFPHCIVLHCTDQHDHRYVLAASCRQGILSWKAALCGQSDQEDPEIEFEPMEFQSKALVFTDIVLIRGLFSRSSCDVIVEVEDHVLAIREKNAAGYRLPFEEVLSVHRRSGAEISVYALSLTVYSVSTSVYTYRPDHCIYAVCQIR